MQSLKPNCNREARSALTARQVNNWARGRATAPVWAVMLAVLLQDHSPEALTIALEEARQDLSAAQRKPR